MHLPKTSERKILLKIQIKVGFYFVERFNHDCLAGGRPSAEWIIRQCKGGPNISGTPIMSKAWRRAHYQGRKIHLSKVSVSNWEDVLIDWRAMEPQQATKQLSPEWCCLIVIKDLWHLTQQPQQWVLIYWQKHQHQPGSNGKNDEVHAWDPII